MRTYGTTSELYFESVILGTPNTRLCNEHTAEISRLLEMAMLPILSRGAAVDFDPGSDRRAWRLTVPARWRNFSGYRFLRFITEGFCGCGTTFSRITWFV